MAEARAAVSTPKVEFHALGTSTAEAEAEFFKGVYKSTKKCLRRTRYCLCTYLCTCLKYVLS